MQYVAFIARAKIATKISREAVRYNAQRLVDVFWVASNDSTARPSGTTRERTLSITKYPEIEQII
jgi:hypothetical protein